MEDYNHLLEMRLQAHSMKVRSHLSPSDISLCQQLGRSIQWQALGPSSSPSWKSQLFQVVTTKVNQHFHVPGNPARANIEALAFLVLMEAANNTSEDLKGIMEEVKGINEEKKKIRELLNQMMEKAEGRRVTWPPQ
jgi:hypothetical protein